MRFVILTIAMASTAMSQVGAQSLGDTAIDPIISSDSERMRSSRIETQILPPIGESRDLLQPLAQSEIINTAGFAFNGFNSAEAGAGAEADIGTQSPADFVLIDDSGSPFSLRPADLYRALGDRVIRKGQVIGNNTLYWNQIDPNLPKRRISESIETSDRAVSPDALLAMVREGCLDSGASQSQCRKVNLRKDSGVPGSGDLRIAAITTHGGAAYSSALTGIDTRPYRSAPQNAMIAAYIAPAPAQPAPVAAMVMERARPLSASRIFLGRSSYPPAEFAAYGILAFTTLPAPEDRERYIEICDAFFAAIISSSELEVPLNEQMVTVWPVDDRTDPGLTGVLNIARAETDSCSIAVDNYDIFVADQAIRDARFAGKSLNGRGPFLIAWSPGDKKGFGQVPVLTADLTDVNSTADAKAVFRVWTDDIEKDTELWATGFSLEKLRLKLRQIANRYGEGMSKYFGG